MSAEATLSQIVESAGSLLKLVESSRPIAEREVKMLQTALDFVLASNEPLNQTKKAQQCKNVLRRLTLYTKSAPSSATGDTDDVVPVGFEPTGAPSQKATKYITKTIDYLETTTTKIGKNMGGGKGSSKATDKKKTAASASSTTADEKSLSQTVAAVTVAEKNTQAACENAVVECAAVVPSTPSLTDVAASATHRQALQQNNKNKKKNQKKKALALLSPTDALRSLKSNEEEGIPTPLEMDSDEEEGEEGEAVEDTEYGVAAATAEEGGAEAVIKHAMKQRKTVVRAYNSGLEGNHDKNDFILQASLARDEYEQSERTARRKEKHAAATSTTSKISNSKAAEDQKDTKSSLKVVKLLEPIIKSVAKVKGKDANKSVNAKMPPPASKTASNNPNKSTNNNGKKQSTQRSANSSFSGNKSYIPASGGAAPKQWRWTNIPMQRRLQTLVISILTFFTGLPLFCALFFVLLFFKYTMPLMVAYLIYILVIFPRKRKWPIKGKDWWRKSWVFEQCRDYFPIRLVVPKKIRREFDPKGNYFFIYHPHGIHSFGAMVCFGADVHNVDQMLPGLTFHVQTLGAQFWAPFWRELVVWAGSGDASAKCIKKTLSAGPGQCPVLVVGGAEESLLSSPKTNVLCLMKRKGFVRIALETGKPLVPVFAFGETNVYYNYAHHIPVLRNFLLKLQKKTKFALPIIVGRGYFNYSFGMLPHRRPINVVVGRPLVVPHIEKPTAEDVDFWHEQYAMALKEHYEEHKGVYDHEGSLVIS